MIFALFQRDYLSYRYLLEILVIIFKNLVVTDIRVPTQIMLKVGLHW